MYDTWIAPALWGFLGWTIFIDHDILVNVISLFTGR